MTYECVGYRRQVETAYHSQKGLCAELRYALKYCTRQQCSIDRNRTEHERKAEPVENEKEVVHGGGTHTQTLQTLSRAPRNSVRGRLAYQLAGHHLRSAT